MGQMEPFATQLDLTNGILQTAGRSIRRHLSDMKDMYADEPARRRLEQEQGDPLVYEVFPVDLPETEAHVLHCTTVIYPGRVGDEYFMTKGHFHLQRKRAEIYLGIAGEGYLLAQTEEGEVRALPMRPGTVVYVPPSWGHRTVNTGQRPFAFFAAWPGDAGHDYETVERNGFARILVERDGQAVLIDNPRRLK